MKTCGFHMLGNFNRQFQKMLELVAREIIPKYHEGGGDGSLSRLKFYLEKYHKNMRRIEVPKGWLDVAFM